MNHKEKFIGTRFLYVSGYAFYPDKQFVNELVTKLAELSISIDGPLELLPFPSKRLYGLRVNKDELMIGVMSGDIQQKIIDGKEKVYSLHVDVVYP